MTNTHHPQRTYGFFGRMILISLFGFLITTSSASAETFISGTLAGDTVWTKENGPYVITNTLTIPADSSLSIRPGTIVKIQGYFFMYVFGSMTVGEGGGERVVITSLKDDSVGGDTNGDGSISSPAAGDWMTFYFLGGAVGSFVNTDMRYGGLPNGPTMPVGLIHNEGGVVNVQDTSVSYGTRFAVSQRSGTSTITNSQIMGVPIGFYAYDGSDGLIISEQNTFESVDTGMYVGGGELKIKDNDFRGVVGYAAQVPLNAYLTNHGGNIGAGGYAISGTKQRSQHWAKDGSVYVIENTLDLRPTTTLRIDPGVIVKVKPNTFTYVNGKLIAGSATSTDPVIVTSFNDDSAGGDTNRDGNLSLPAPGESLPLYFLDGSHGIFQNVEFRYGGRWNGPTMPTGQILNQGGKILIERGKFLDPENYGYQQSYGSTTIRDSEFARAGKSGIYVQDGILTVHNSSIHDNREYGVFNASTTHDVDATSNWWGASNGPKFPPDPFNPDQGSGDRVSAHVKFRPFLVTEPTPPCTIECYPNVLFIPGVKASRLYVPEEDCTFGDCEDRLWEPNADSDVRELFLNPDGTSINQNIYTKDVVDEFFSVGNGDVYGSFSAFMDELVATGTIEAWDTVPYDWRLDLETVVNGGKDDAGKISYITGTSSSYAIGRFLALAETSKNGKVTIIAHSNGGLFTKLLVNKLRDMGYGDLVDSIIFVAVPQYGTPKAIASLLHGYDESNAFGIVTKKSTARAFAENSPAGYNLLPSEAYFSRVATPPVVFNQTAKSTQIYRNAYGNEIDSYGALQAFLLGLEGRAKPETDDVDAPNILNGTLLSRAFNLHQILDNWTPPANTKLYEIAGVGIPTFSSLEYEDSCKKCLFGTPKLSVKPRLVIDGDGTVVWSSANSGVGQNYFFDIKSWNELYKTEIDHGTIMGADHIKQMIKTAIVGGSPDDFPATITSTMPDITGNKLLLHSIHSPVTLGLYDSHGNFTGVATTTLSDGRELRYVQKAVQESGYEEIGEVKYAFTNANIPVRVVLRGEGIGAFTYGIEEMDGNQVAASTTFANIPVSTSSIITIEFAGGVAGASNLLIDEDGDGATDFELVPKLGDIVSIPERNKVPLTVTANDRTIVYGSAMPALDATFSGLEIGDSATTSISGMADCTTTATTGSPVGSYPIMCTAGTLASEKYVFPTFVPGTLKIVYGWRGFSQPINDTKYYPAQAPSVFKGGSTVPVKFTLRNASGSPVEASTTPVWLSPQKDSAMSAQVDESLYSDPATSGNTYRYDPTAQQYIYNWSTKGLAPGYWYRIYAKLDDGTIQSVVVGLR